MKRCTKCKQARPIVDFGRDRTRGDGLAATCLPCRRVKVRVNRKGVPSGRTGRQFVEAAIAAAIVANRGHKRRLGIRHTEDSKRKMSETKRARGVMVGPKNHRWKEDRSSVSDRLKPEYRIWRDAVFKRDNFTCQKCGDDRGGNLCAHHVKAWATHPELRFDIGNGLTLCHVCHELEHFKPDSIRSRRKLQRGEPLWIEKLQARMEQG